MRSSARRGRSSTRCSPFWSIPRRTGIVLTGGGSLLYGFDKLISERTEIACSIADDADSCVANGCGRSLQWISSMQEGTINLARRKLMKEQ